MDGSNPTTRYTLTRSRLNAGKWEAVVVADGPASADPQIEVVHLDTPLEGVTLKPDGEMPSLWTVSVPIPAKLLSDGVLTFIVRDKPTGDQLDHFTIVAGTLLEEDVRAELSLLRAELDMLKAAFRRHVRGG